jgi:signal transduction histidine kinase
MRKWPLQLAAPSLVLLLGLGIAFTMVWLGRGQIRREADREAQHRAGVYASTMAARLRFTPLEDRARILGEAALATDLTMLLSQSDGSLVADQTDAQLSPDAVVTLLVRGEGATDALSKRARFATHPLGPPLEHLSVVVFVDAPEDPEPARNFVGVVSALTALLVGLAFVVAQSYARAANHDIRYVADRIRSLAHQGEGPPPSERSSLLVDADAKQVEIPVRSFDEVGELTASFNILVERFKAREKSYRADLAEAAQTDKDRLEFLAGLSHELRTPLNAILGFSHVLESEVDGPLTDDTRESIEIIRTSGEHLRTLIDDILDLSLLEVDQLRLSRSVVDVVKLAQEVVREARALAKHKGLELVVKSTGAVLASADKRRLRQILTNLVSNAVKFTSRGSVTVSVLEHRDMARIEVEDTGLGIPEDARATIFEAYKQVGATHLRHGGAGLGLATVKRLVLLHGGDVGVEAGAQRGSEGGGSRFIVLLPLAGAEEVQAAEARASIPPQRGDA